MSDELFILCQSEFKSNLVFCGRERGQETEEGIDLELSGRSGGVMRGVSCLLFLLWAPRWLARGGKRRTEEHPVGAAL